MPEQDIEMQILEELQKLKSIVAKSHEAENAYRNSSEILDKAIKEYSNLSELRDELNGHAHTTREDLHKIFLIWSQSNNKKMDYLNGEFAKLTISLPKDISPQFNEVKNQVEKSNSSISSILEQLNQLKKQQASDSTNFSVFVENTARILKEQQASNTTNIVRLGFFLIFLIVLLALFFK